MNEPGLPDLKTTIAIIAAVGGLIGTVIAWLDKRAKKQRDETLAEHSALIEAMRRDISTLQDEVRSLQNGQRAARALLVEAIRLTDPEKAKDHIQKAMDSLH